MEFESTLGKEYVSFGKDIIRKYKRFFFPTYVQFEGEDLPFYNLPMRDEEILVASFPKSGTTWVQAIVYHILNGVDVVDARTRNYQDFFPFMDEHYEKIKDILANHKRCLIKTHLAYQFLPRSFHENKGKVIYVARNPKDGSVSLHHFYRMYKPVSLGDTIDLDFMKAFVNGQVAFGPWWKHVAGYWEHHNDDNLLFLFYEDLIQKRELVIANIAQFLGTTVTSDEITTIAEATHFENMKKYPLTYFRTAKTNTKYFNTELDFFRKGIVGDWKNHYTAEMNNLVDTMVTEHLHGSGLKFTYDDRDQDKY